MVRRCSTSASASRIDRTTAAQERNEALTPRPCAATMPAFNAFSSFAPRAAASASAAAAARSCAHAFSFSSLVRWICRSSATTWWVCAAHISMSATLDETASLTFSNGPRFSRLTPAMLVLVVVLEPVLPVELAPLRGVLSSYGLPCSVT